MLEKNNEVNYYIQDRRTEYYYGIDEEEYDMSNPNESIGFGVQTTLENECTCDLWQINSDTGDRIKLGIFDELGFHWDDEYAQPKWDTRGVPEGAIES